MRCGRLVIDVLELRVEAQPPVRRRRAPMAAWDRRIAVCAGVAIVLAAWVLLFPYTGDGDSILHFVTAQEVWHKPSLALIPWARPLHKLLLLVPASHGIIPARLVQAAITIALLWQTMRLAEQLKFPRPEWAGLFVIWQPYVFSLAADTMTELPFALGMVIALQLWLAGRIAWSSFTIGLLPLLRPEGFFLGALWAGMLVFPPSWNPRRLGRQLLSGLPGLAGVLAWAIASKIIVGNWRYFLDAWSWPAQSYGAYPSGPIWHHIALWPDYCGLVLTPLFVIGFGASLRRRGMTLPLAVWTTVILVHSILYWGHWFASLGLMRIMATTAPVTALVCYDGWIGIVHWLQRHRRASQASLRRLGVALAIAAWAWVVVRYWYEPDHHRCFPIRTAARYIIQHDLLAGGANVFAADKMCYAELGLPTLNLPSYDFDRAEILRRLAAMPAGTIGLWDNQKAHDWFHVEIDDVLAQGYEALHEQTARYPQVPFINYQSLGGPANPMRYVVLRKK